jgi:prolyl-tRNA synthetase
MTSSKLTKEIQTKFNLHHIYAKNLLHKIPSKKKVSLEEIEKIIKEEIEAVGGVEISMTALQNPEIWKAVF